MDLELAVLEPAEDTRSPAAKSTKSTNGESVSNDCATRPFFVAPDLDGVAEGRLPGQVGAVRAQRHGLVRQAELDPSPTRPSSWSRGPRPGGRRCRRRSCRSRRSGSAWSGTCASPPPPKLAGNGIARSFEAGATGGWPGGSTFIFQSVALRSSARAAIGVRARISRKRRRRGPSTVIDDPPALGLRVDDTYEEDEETRAIIMTAGREVTERPAGNQAHSRVDAASIGPSPEAEGRKTGRRTKEKRRVVSPQGGGPSTGVNRRPIDPRLNHVPDRPDRIGPEPGDSRGNHAKRPPPITILLMRSSSLSNHNRSPIDGLLPPRSWGKQGESLKSWARSELR